MNKERIVFILLIIAVITITTTLTITESRKGYVKLSDVLNYSEKVCIASYPRQTILECPCDNMNMTRCQRSPVIKIATNDLARDYEGFVIKGECRIANITFEQKVSVYDCDLNVSDPLISTLELNLTLR